MDFATRDNYRHAVEKIAKKSNLSEYEVARAAINLAKKSAVNEANNKRKAHVGYYLIDKGASLTEYIAHITLTGWQSVLRALARATPTLYFISTFLITLGVTSAMVFKAYNDGVRQNLW